MKLEVIPAFRWAETVAVRWRESLIDDPALRMCLPTGTTPIELYQRMWGVSFEGSTVFLLDEFGGLPPQHRGRCQIALRRWLLDHLVGPPSSVHMPDVDAVDVDSICRQYDESIADGGLDLALLGLGVNGHLGLNEPGSAPDSPTRVVELTAETRARSTTYGIENPPTWGVTIGLGPLLAARQIWLLVTGAGKRQVLRRVIEDPIGRELPASYLRGHPDTVIWADEAAASFL